jgi:hypothetical protein
MRTPLGQRQISRGRPINLRETILDDVVIRCRARSGHRPREPFCTDGSDPAC